MSIMQCNDVRVKRLIFVYTSSIYDNRFAGEACNLLFAQKKKITKKAE